VLPIGRLMPHGFHRWIERWRGSSATISSRPA